MKGWAGIWSQRCLIPKSATPVLELSSFPWGTGSHFMPGVLKERKQRTVLANTMASVCLHARQDLPTKEGKAWPICDLGSSSPYHVGLPLPPSKIRTLLGIQFSGIYCLSYILMIEEQGHHYGTAFLVVLFTFMIYCGRDRRTPQSPGKLFQNIHACPRPLRI